jgi:hypothetical protein
VRAGTAGITTLAVSMKASNSDCCSGPLREPGLMPMFSMDAQR